MSGGIRSGTYANNGAGVGPLNDSGTGAATTVPLGAAASAGDCLLVHPVALETGGHAAPTFTVSDSVNGAWSIEAATNTTTVVGLNGRSSVWLFPNSAAGTPVITVTSNGGSGHTYNVGVECVALTGIVTTSPKDTSAAAASNTANASSGNVSPATGAAGEFMIGAYADFGEGITLAVGNVAGSTATLIGKHDADGGKWEGLLEFGDSGSSGGTPSASITQASNTGWIMLAVVIKVTAGAAQDTPELYGRPFGRFGQREMQQLLAQFRRRTPAGLMVR